MQEQVQKAPKRGLFGLRKRHLAAAGLGALVGLLVAEIALRVLAPVHLTAPVRAYEYDEQLAVRLRSSMAFARTTDYRHEITTNALGTTDFREALDGYDALVFAMGDSYTEGMGVPCDASYPFQLDLMLNVQDSRYHRRYAVVNLGAAGYGSEQALLTLKRYSERIGTPDYVLYLGCDNDAVDDVLFKSGYRHKHLVDGNPRWGVFTKPLQWLTNDLECGKRAKLIIGRLRRDRLLRRAKRKRAGLPEVTQVAPTLERFAATTKDMGAKLVVSWTVARPRQRESYEWLRRWASGHGAGFADWLGEVQSVQKAMPKLSLMNPHSGAHYRTWANAAIARAFAREILGTDRAAEAPGADLTAERSPPRHPRTPPSPPGR